MCVCVRIRTYMRAGVHVCLYSEQQKEEVSSCFVSDLFLGKEEEEKGGRKGLSLRGSEPSLSKKKGNLEGREWEIPMCGEKKKGSFFALTSPFNFCHVLAGQGEGGREQFPPKKRERLR